MYRLRVKGLESQNLGLTIYNLGLRFAGQRLGFQDLKIPEDVPPGPCDPQGVPAHAPLRPRSGTKWPCTFQSYGCSRAEG